MKLAIIGAGLSGVMAYKYFKEMSYVESVKVFEIKDSCDFLKSHTALLRIKSVEIVNLLKCRYKKIKIEKNYLSDGVLKQTPSIKDRNDYSKKVIGAIHSRSIGSISEYSDRYLIDLSSVKIEESDFNFNTDYYSCSEKFDAVISTIPLFSILEKESIHTEAIFKSTPVETVTADVKIDMELDL